MPAIQTTSLSHTYRKAKQPALQDLNLEIQEGEIFGLLGPNGGGKTTLFRILSTLLVPTRGDCKVLGLDVRTHTDAIRRGIGVVFQSPSLDKKLTVRENMMQQGYLYGLSGKSLAVEVAAMAERFGLEEKFHEKTETLSGGLRRRVDLAKGILHRPRLLLLDEPSTGLDPGVRRDIWSYLLALRKETGVTILLTTHILDEAERCDRLAFIDKGKLAAIGTPDELKSSVGGDVITLSGKEPQQLCEQIRSRFSLPAAMLDDTVRLEIPRGHECVPKLMEAFPGQIESLRIGKPTLEDVFIDKTGHRFENGQP